MSLWNIQITHWSWFIAHFLFLVCYSHVKGDMRWCSWLRHCATILKSHGFDSRWGHWISHWLNPSDRMALGSNQFLTEMSTRIISWGVKVASAKAGRLCHLHVPNVYKFWVPQNPGGHRVYHSKELNSSLFCKVMLNEWNRCPYVAGRRIGKIRPLFQNWYHLFSFMSICIPRCETQWQSV